MEVNEQQHDPDLIGDVTLLRAEASKERIQNIANPGANTNPKAKGGEK